MHGALKVALSVWLVVIGPASRALAEDGADARETDRQAEQLLARGDRYYLSGDLRGAGAHYQRALTLYERSGNRLGQAKSLTELGRVALDLFRIDTAEALFQRSLSIRRRERPPIHADLAEIELSLGAVALARGQPDRAEARFRTALDIGQKALGSEHPNLIEVHRSLGTAAAMGGLLSKAKTSFREALRLSVAALGPEHPRTAEARIAWAKHLVFANDLETGLGELERGVQILRRSRGPRHLSTLGGLLALGTTARRMRQLDRAATVLGEAWANALEVLPSSHPLVAEISHQVGLVALDQGRVGEAERFLRGAWQLRRRSWGEGHPNTVDSIHSLAPLLHGRGAHREASALFQSGLTALEALYPADALEIGRFLEDRSLHYFEVGKTREALDDLDRMLRIQDAAIARLVASGSERQMRLLLNRHFLDLPISVHLQHAPHSNRAARLAFETSLRRKGLELDISLMGARASRRGAGADSGPRAELERLGGQRVFLGRGLAEGGDPRMVRARIDRLDREIDRLEDQLRTSDRQAAGMAYRVATADIASIQARLAPRRALVDFVVYTVVHSRYLVDPRRPREVRYAVALLHATGEPRWIDLGPAVEMERLASDFRAALAPDSRTYREAGRALYEATFAPLEPWLEGIDQLEVSPNGTLQVVPFGALVDRQGQYLVERFSIQLLASGRDLLAAEAAPGRWRGAYLVGDVDYGPAVPSLPGAAADGPFGGLVFQPLPGTRREIESIRAILGLDATEVVRGAGASEARLRDLRGPTILHIATHGFFRRERTDEPARWRETGRLVEPLLRSGLALAGANRWRRAPGALDGIATAGELQSLDLEGTELVVLSACETGLGEIEYNRGIYGLRRALAIAGARTQVLSLWPVSDRRTADFMSSFYGQLATGVDRTEALRRAQLAFLRGQPLPMSAGPRRGAETRGVERKAGRPAARHPYYWAGFVASGARGEVPSPTPRRDPARTPEH